MQALLFALSSAVAVLGPPEESAIEGPNPAVAPTEATPPTTDPSEPSEPSGPSEPPPPMVIPEGTTPPGEQGGPEIPEDEPPEPGLTFAKPTPEPRPLEPEPEPDLDDPYEYEQREWEDMPYAPTAARVSAVQRNNDVLVRSFDKPVYTIAAAGRFATSLIGGNEVVQPFGFGIAAQLRIHFLRVFKSRFGVEVYAGYTRFPERVQYAAVEGVTAEITRLNLLAHTDLSAGPSLQIPIGPLFLQFGGSVGVGFSTLNRTQSIDALDDELAVSTDLLLRGGLSLGIPIFSRHGLTVGSGVQHVFSRDQVDIDLGNPDAGRTQPFGTWLEINLGYQMWF